METEKYEIIYADPPWSYYNDMTVTPDCTTSKGMRRQKAHRVVFALQNRRLGYMGKRTYK